MSLEFLKNLASTWPCTSQESVLGDEFYGSVKKTQSKLILMEHLKSWTWITIKRNSFSEATIWSSLYRMICTKRLTRYKKFEEPYKFSLQELKKRLAKYEKSSIAYGSFLRIVHAQRTKFAKVSRSHKRLQSLLFHF